MAMLALAACHGGAPRVIPGGSPPPVVESVPQSVATPARPEGGERDADLPIIAQESAPPCLPFDSKPKAAPKRKPRPATPLRAAPAEAPTPAPVVAAGDAELRTMAVSMSTLLGRKVQGLDGEDMGRVVDVLTDAAGDTHIAIIEFGGFLGVGNRRLAVEWSLLKFNPQDPSAPLTLNVNKARIQSAPDYKDTSAHPPALMPPAAAATDAGQ